MRITFSPQESRDYNLGDALYRMATGIRRDGLAFDVSDALAEHMERKTDDSLLIPYQMDRAGLDSGTSTKGTELRFDQPKPFLDMLRIQSVVGRAGATFLTGLQGQVKFPRETAQAAPVAQTENPGSDASDTNLLLAQTAMSPKDIIATTSYSVQLLSQSRVAVGVDEIVRRDMALATAVVLDGYAFTGTGASGQPTGIISASGIGSVTLGTNGGTVTWATLAAIERTTAVANADFPENAWVTTPTMREGWRLRDRVSNSTTGTTGWMVMGDEKFGTLLSHPVLVSASVPANLTKGTSTTICSCIAYGLWSEMYVGSWGPGLEVVVDPMTKKKQGMVEVTSLMLADIGFGRPGALTRCVDAIP
jgi:HK97 family phage major capsid protein